MRTIVYATFPHRRTSELARRTISAQGFLTVSPNDLRTLCAGAGEHLDLHPVGVSTARPESAAQHLRELGAVRVRTMSDTRDLSHDPEPVDQAGRESFPASDPPAWTL